MAWTAQRKAVTLAVGLALTTLALFLPAIQGDFVNCDDPVYVTENPKVLGGLTWDGIGWAMGAAQGGHWHPLTWVSHLADVQWAGLRPWGHHFTNVLLHALNAGLCLLAFRALTGALWRSLALATLWAWHPLRVESVAWIAERKDVLSGLFWFAALWSYAEYVRTKRRWRLGLTLGLFALGLMSKPMVLTLPFVLLLLDAWPLRRATWSPKDVRVWGRLLLEKVPFFALTAVSMAVTVWAAKQSDSVASMDAVPLAARVANALVSYSRYVAKSIWPIELAVYYPFPERPESALAVVALLLGIGVTVVVLARWTRQGYLGTGWFWYLGTLVPVIGFVQAGAQAMADRFSYLPALGLGLMLTWGLADWAAGRRWARVATPAAAAVVAVLFATVSVHQLTYWRDSVTLFTRTCQVTKANWLAESALGEALLQENRFPEAIEHLQRALELDPKNFIAIANLGNVMFKLGRLDEAVNYYESGRSLKPDHAGLSWMLGRTLLRQRKLDAAEQALRHALRFAPDQAEARTDLAEVLMLRGRAPEALDELTRVVQAQPRALEPRQQLAATLAAAGRTADAVQQYRELLRLTPDAPLVLNNLAWILATHPDASLRDGAEAVRLAERACQLVGNREAFLLGTLAAAYAEAGRFDEAVRTSTQAITLADQNGQSAVATSNRGLLDLYKAAKPYRDVATNAPPR